MKYSPSITIEGSGKRVPLEETKNAILDIIAKSYDTYGDQGYQVAVESVKTLRALVEPASVSINNCTFSQHSEKTDA